MTQNAEIHRTITTLDHPPRLLFWGMYDLLLFVIPLVVALLTGMASVLAAGLGIIYLVKRLLRRFPKAILFHRLYWNLPHSAFAKVGLLRNLPPSHRREFLL